MQSSLAWAVDPAGSSERALADTESGALHTSPEPAGMMGGVMGDAQSAEQAAGSCKGAAGNPRADGGSSDATPAVVFHGGGGELDHQRSTASQTAAEGLARLAGGSQGFEHAAGSSAGAADDPRAEAGRTVSGHDASTKQPSSAVQPTSEAESPSSARLPPIKSMIRLQYGKGAPSESVLVVAGAVHLLNMVHLLNTVGPSGQSRRSVCIFGPRAGF